MDFIIEMSKTEYVYYSIDEMLEKFKKWLWRKKNEMDKIRRWKT